MQYAIYFVIGVTFNLIGISITECVIRDKRMMATLLTGLMTAIRLTTMTFVIADAISEDYWSIPALAVGTMVGTYLAFIIGGKRE